MTYLVCAVSLLAPVMIIIIFPLMLFCALYQAKLAKSLKAYPEDYRNMLVGGKPYLYIESPLTAGVPQAIQEQIKFFRYFIQKKYLGKFSERQRNIYLRAWYALYIAVGLSLVAVLAGFICLSGLRHQLA